jgi:hypothetical protein
MPAQIIEIRHFQDGWKVYCDNSEPYFVGPAAIEHAIAFAREKVKSGPAEIRLVSSDGRVISQIPENFRVDRRSIERPTDRRLT